MTLQTRLTDLLNLSRDLQLMMPDRLSTADREEVGEVDRWSAKDNLVHGIVWADRLLEDLEFLEEEGAWPEHDYGIDDEENEAIFEAYQNADWPEVRDMIADSYDSLGGFMEELGEEGLLRQAEGRPLPVWRAIAGSYILHPTVHVWDYLHQHGYDHVNEEFFNEEFTQQLLALSEDDGWRGTNIYNMACRDAQSGQTQRAITRLAEALRLDPRLVAWSKEDSDLDSLRGDPAYQALYE